MPAPLRILMVALWVSSAAGVLVIAALSLGHVSPLAFVVSGALGLLVGVPAGIWTARAIKRQDPAWPPDPA